MNEPNTGAGRRKSISDDERRKLILDAAEKVFDQKGYGDATMEEISQAAGMAKKSVYKLFPDKPAVFCELINTHDDVLKTGLSRPVTSDPRQQIRHLLHDTATFVLAPRQLRLTRLIIAETRKNPELAERFNDACMEKSLDVFLERLNSVHEMSGIDRAEAMVIADIFLGAVIGPLQFRALILPSHHDDLLAKLDSRVELATDLMMNYLNWKASGACATKSVRHDEARSGPRDDA